MAALPQVLPFQHPVILGILLWRVNVTKVTISNHRASPWKSVQADRR